MMDTETLQLIAQFMGRAELKGSEVEAFNRCMAALTQAHTQASQEAEETPSDS